MIDISSNGIMTSARFDNKPKQKYGLFDKFPLSVIGSCEVHNNPHIFLTRENQHIQETNIHFDGTLNKYVTRVFTANKGQNKWSLLSAGDMAAV